VRGHNDFIALNHSVRVVRKQRQRLRRRPPPAVLIFLHRELAGLFLPCTRLDAREDVAGWPARQLQQRIEA
jgi:hypothetical protein